MRYEPPMIVAREALAGHLALQKSQIIVSDRGQKDNIVPVAWPSDTTVAYEAPAVVARESLHGHLTVSRSQEVDSVPSDREIKDRIVPVTWSRRS